jgi:hypothetical protein
MRFLILVMIVIAGAISVSAQTEMEKNLMAMEKGAWDAFGKGDGKYFESFLADDFMLVSNMGITGKAQSIKDITGKPCELKTYAIANYKVTMINPDTALATYEATQDATCGGMAAPAKVYASSMFVKRKGKWLAVQHQETPAMAMKK